MNDVRYSGDAYWEKLPESEDIMFNNAKNAVIAAIAGAQDYGVRYLYLPNKRYKDDNGKVRKGMLRHACYDDTTGFAVEGAGESVALQIATRTLAQYADAYEQEAWAGHIALVLPKNAAIRVHSIRGLLNAGNDAEDIADILADRVSEYYTMSDSQKEAIADFAEVMEHFMDEDNNISVREYDAFNLRHWRLRVSDDVELKEGQELEFVKDSDDNVVAMDGEVTLETNGQSYVGKHKVVLAADGRNSDGSAKMVYAIERIGESQRLKNIQKLWEKTLGLFNEEDDIDSMEDVEEVDEVEESVDEMEDAAEN